MSKRKSIPPEGQRCTYTRSDGKRCRHPRLPGEHTLCYNHQFPARRRVTEPHPGLMAHKVLPTEGRLDSAESVNAMLTRLVHCVAHGDLSPRHAAALGYLCQLIMATLPGMHRESAEAPQHPILGANPEAAIANLARSLARALPQPGPGDDREPDGEAAAQDDAVGKPAGKKEPEG